MCGGPVPNGIRRDGVFELCRWDILGLDGFELELVRKLCRRAVPNQLWSIGVHFMQPRIVFVDDRFEHDRMRFVRPRQVRVVIW